jgi:hypothetical protein
MVLFENRRDRHNRSNLFDSTKDGSKLGILQVYADEPAYGLSCMVKFSVLWNGCSAGPCTPVIVTILDKEKHSAYNDERLIPWSRFNRYCSLYFLLPSL